MNNFSNIFLNCFTGEDKEKVRIENEDIWKAYNLKKLKTNNSEATALDSKKHFKEYRKAKGIAAGEDWHHDADSDDGSLKDFDLGRAQTRPQTSNSSNIRSKVDYTTGGKFIDVKLNSKKLTKLALANQPQKKSMDSLNGEEAITLIESQPNENNNLDNI